ncbi:MAG: hypothetical protein KH108_15540 [Faecalibacterium prausnitzii]|nr:hypothetical protein [Faecalibacterium prausnitzii]
MKYREIVDGIFLDRPNRFIAHVDVNGTAETVHVKNTGRCKELLLQFSVSRHSGIFHHLQVGQTVGIPGSFNFLHLRSRHNAMFHVGTFFLSLL